MPAMSPGGALREIQRAHAGLKKARQFLKMGRDDPRLAPKIFEAGWSSLLETHRLLASIPSEAVDDAVLTKQLALERYATALLVRLRRLRRQESSGTGADLDDELFDDGGEE